MKAAKVAKYVKDRLAGYLINEIRSVIKEYAASIISANQFYGYCISDRTKRYK